ncbi:hypothetical protein ACD575_00440 [Campylobacter sp. LH-2024]|uniref:Uncharacterized protein n=1 Tax=Campylobacter molothri TaxID=1032242 RepID=A0ACC5VYP0_9BACT|nr:hypothetical protein [Campylobacter sp. 2018MI35]MBZ7928312.1 hypothetical protein [Campylobacter sp. RM10542]MBZ7929251.1 hypothetical protein [Campylobacter sp. W0067]MBZ7930750.1 hypothetical protein [Campylobacter sp. RM12910]MBZ7932242.1 hypothetical protein [Campylobacter sp. RM10543]MBZ7933753.1 hypothetical protein [Campylobacter sp. W0065]MBZ7937141.1 hypothetical protein [Campylobacter sp. RM10538]MBZ7940263.1 hypothetical protein [Campylobacter sp. W0047]MBZ7943152.1 hypotheti
MIFLIPLLIIVGVIFGIDHLYFSNENNKIESKKEVKQEINSSLIDERSKYIEKLFNSKSKQ